jgi:ABC-2 type transport system ATP-binding protein
MPRTGRTPNLAAAALVIVVAAALMGLPGTASAATGYTEKALKFDVLVGPNNDMQCTVDANLFTPDGASAAHPVPAMLATNGFGGSKADFDTLGPSYAQRGFAFLAYSGLGFGGSGCKIELDDPDYDGKAGSQLVSFLGGSKAATDGTKIDYIVHDATAHDGSHHPDDPRVGMLGGSYGGEIQFAVAEQDPRVDAINPQITWNDLSYSLTPNNTSFTSGVTYATPGVVKADWPALFFGEGIADGLQETAGGDPSHVGQCPNFDDRACPGIIDAAASSYPDDTTLAFLRHASVSTYMSRIRIPTLLAQGENDTLFDLQEATATYESLRAQGTPVRMLWRSSGHSGGSLGNSESDDANPDAGYESRMELQWFQYYLQGKGSAPAQDFTFYRPWVPYSGDAAPAVGEVPSYPAAAPTRMFLSGTSALATTASQVQSGSASMAASSAAPSSTGGGFVSGPDVNPPGTAVTYSTPPLSANTDVVGISSLNVDISAPTFAASQSNGPAGMLELFAKIDDYDPSTGQATLPANLVSAVRIADVTKPVTIQLPGIVYRFPKGHQIRLVISTSDETFRGNNVAGPVTVSTSPGAPGVLSIPILTGTVASLGGASSSSSVPGGGTSASGVAACISRRHFVIHLPRARRGQRIVRATVFVAGRRVKVVSGRRLHAAVNLTGLPKGRFRIRIVERLASGHTRTSSRRYRTCTPGHRTKPKKPRAKRRRA